MTAANCRKTIDLLADFLDGVLSPEDDAALRAHMANCPKCIEFLESYRGTSRIIREVTDVEMPEDLEQRLLSFLEQRDRRR